MAYMLNLAEAAEDDIRQAYLWYNEQQDELGETFKQHVSRAMGSIRENPLKIQIHYGHTRVFFLKKFPFGIHFNVSHHQILVVAVLHTARNPEKWEERT